MHRLSLGYERLLNVLATIAALILLAMVILVTTDIALRNLTRTGFPWSNEVSEYALYAVTLLAAPWLLRRGQHVRVDLVLNLVSPRIARMMEAASDVLGIAVCLLMARSGLIMTYQSWQLGSITIKNLVFPEWWLLAPLPLSFILLAVEFVFRLHRLLTGGHIRRADATSVS